MKKFLGSCAIDRSFDMKWREERRDHQRVLAVSKVSVLRNVSEVLFLNYLLIAAISVQTFLEFSINGNLSGIDFALSRYPFYVNATDSV